MKEISSIKIVSLTLRWSFMVVSLFLLSGCQGAGGPVYTPQDQRDVLLGVIGFFLFLGTLIYAGYKAFVELNLLPGGMNRPRNRIEYRTRPIGFFIGILITVLIIVADSAQTPLSSATILALFPWYIFTCPGVLCGFAIGLATGLIGQYRGTSGVGFLVLVFSFLGGTGLYLSLQAAGLRSNVLAAIISVQIGVLFFRLLFPTGISTVTAEE